nr:cornifelin isoform X1 [Equus caballus]
MFIYFDSSMSHPQNTLPPPHVPSGPEWEENAPSPREMGTSLRMLGEAWKGNPLSLTPVAFLLSPCPFPVNGCGGPASTYLLLPFPSLCLSFLNLSLPFLLILPRSLWLSILSASLSSLYLSLPSWPPPLVSLCPPFLSHLSPSFGLCALTQLCPLYLLSPFSPPSLCLSLPTPLSISSVSSLDPLPHDFLSPVRQRGRRGGRGLGDGKGGRGSPSSGKTGLAPWAALSELHPGPHGLPNISSSWPRLRTQCRCHPHLCLHHHHRSPAGRSIRLQPSALRASKMQFEMRDNVKGKAMSYPVTSQPQCASSSYQTQLSDWHTGLTDCCNDMPICLCGTFAPLCLACRISDDFGECCCAPYLPGGLHSIRTGMRERYHIQGSVGHDWAALTFCLPCALCQMARELKIRE